MNTINSLIIKKRNYHENDLIITLISQGGKQECIAKSALKSTSKKSSKLDILNLIRATIVEGRVHKILTEVNLLDSFSNLKSENNIFITWVFSECLSILAENIDFETVDFDKVINVIQKANNSPKEIYYFYSKIILYIYKFSGFQINFDNYFDAETKILPDVDRYVDFKENTLGFVVNEKGNNYLVSDDEYKILKYLSNEDFDFDVSLFSNHKHVSKDLFMHLIYWLENITGSVVKSKAILAQF